MELPQRKAELEIPVKQYYDNYGILSSNVLTFSLSSSSPLSLLLSFCRLSLSLSLLFITLPLSLTLMSILPDCATVLMAEEDYLQQEDRVEPVTMETID